MTPRDTEHFRPRTRFAVGGVFALLLFLGCGPKPIPSTAPEPAGFDPKKLGDPAGIHNLFAITPWLYSGSEPEGDAGFQSLQTLGIRTVITVDGAKPDLDRAAKVGMRYVHLPIGYNAIPQDQLERIAKALRDLPRPIYLHCHHGKHRGPSAAVGALRCLDGSCGVLQAVEFLKKAGTDPKYAELYGSVEKQKPLEPAAFDKVSGEFPSAAAVPDFVATMIEIDHDWDRLKSSQAKGWKDGNPASDALLLHEQYRELLRQPQKDGLKALLQQAEAASKDLAEALQPGSATMANRDPAFARSGQFCSQCHKEHRDKSK